MGATKLTTSSVAEEWIIATLGTVQDASGGRVADARVATRQLQDQTRHQIKTDTRGEFRLDNLPPGSYRVTVDAPGFAEASADVAVEVSTVHDVTVTLQPASMRQSVKRTRLHFVNHDPAARYDFGHSRRRGYDARS